MTIDKLQDLILSTEMLPYERLLEREARVRLIYTKTVEEFIAAGGTIEKIGSEMHAELDGYSSKTICRDGTDPDFERFLPVLWWAKIRLKDKLYQEQEKSNH